MIDPAPFTLHHGDALAVLESMPSASVDAIITDPPYSSGGMFRGDRTKDTGDKYVIDQGQEQVPAGGWVWRGIVPWNKTEATRPQKGWFRSQCEYVVVAAKGIPATLDMTGKTDVPALPGFYVCPVERGTVHQTQKPVDLLRWICQLVPKDGIVLDPFAGSGTTGVAALMEQRHFIGIEMSEHYAHLARGRLASAVQGGAQATIEALC